jgi:BRCA1-associated protein
MDIATQHIWDYAGDGYVHRLVQNKADGKLVDLPAAVWSGKGKDVDGGMAAFGADMVPREKMEAMGNEYTYLLTSQLDSQRQYFEEQLLRAVKKASDAASSAEKAVTEMMNLSQQLMKVEIQHAESQTKIENLEKEISRTRKRAEKADALARKFGNDWKEEKTVNDSLMERIKFLDERIKAEEKKREHLEAEKSDLEDQNRDLFLHITNSEKLKNAGEDVIEGTMEVGAQPESSTPTGRKRKGKK